MSPAFFLIFVSLIILIMTSLIAAQINFALFYAGLFGALLLTHFLDQYPYRSTRNFFGKFLIILFIFGIFSTIGELTKVIHPVLFDNQLNAIDISLFGVSPVKWISDHIQIPLLTEWLQVNYFFYFPVGFTAVFIFYFKRNEYETDFTYFSITLALLLSYVIYIIVPAVGPRDGLDEPHLSQNLIIQYQSQLKGLFFTSPIRDFLNQMEKIKTDAFPSGHTAITLLALRHFFRFNKKLFWVMLPVGLSIVASTIFCRYHYVIDVIAGFILFLIVILIDRRFYRFLLRLLNQMNKIHIWAKK